MSPFPAGESFVLRVHNKCRELGELKREEKYFVYLKMSRKEDKPLEKRVYFVLQKAISRSESVEVKIDRDGRPAEENHGEP